MHKDAGATVVTYEGLPLGSGGAHGLGRIGPRDAYRRTVDFIAHSAVVVGPRTQTFHLRDVPELVASAEWNGVLQREFGDRMASATPVADDRMEEALDFLERVTPQPQNQWGMAPLLLRASWKIAVIDPMTGTPFPGQQPPRFPGLGYNSRLDLHLDSGASLKIELCIPDLDDLRLRELLTHLQLHAPFRFSAKQWRRWTVGKTGAFTSRKINLG